jgi:hypothetical protein
MSFLRYLFVKKDETIKSYADFWSWFKRNEKIFFKVIKEQKNIEQDFFDKLAPKLNELKDGIYYLTGMFDDDTVELILTPEGVIKDVVFVEELVSSAPEIAGWRFTALKPAMDINDVNITMAGFKFHKGNLSFYANKDADFPDEIDITVVYSDFSEDKKSAIRFGTFIFLDNFIGELNFATSVDEIIVDGKADEKAVLMPIEKLKDYLLWRQKEFIEKYDGVYNMDENGSYSLLEAKLQNGNKKIAAINTDLLMWDSKASHPWLLKIDIKYDGASNHGMPDSETYKLIREIEEKITDKLAAVDGHLYIGRETAEGTREVYFACKDFRYSSKVVHQIGRDYESRLELSYIIYKDKYWRSYNRFVNP